MEIAAADHEDDFGWVEDAADHEPATETTSSEDELLSAVEVEGEEAASWLIDVGLGDIVTTLLENGNLVTETTLANAVREEGLTSSQYQTVRKRVETLRATLKGRKTRTGGTGQHSRPDCRDIFASPDQAHHSGGSSGRSRSATPDDESPGPSSLKASTENLLISPAASPKIWTRSRNYEESKTPDSVEVDGSIALANIDQIMKVTFANPLPILSPSTNTSEARQRRRSERIEANKKNVVVVKPKPSRASLFVNPTAQGHVAATDKKGIEIVKYKAVDTLPLSYGRRSNSDPFNKDVIKILPVIQQPRISLEDGLTPAQHRKLRQLALLELTALMDNHGLVVRKRNRLRVRITYQQGARERSFFGVPLKKLVEKDQSRVPLIFTMLVDVLKKHHLEEDGLLRVSGNKQKVLVLQKLIETQWKGHVDAKNVNTVRKAIESAGPHELGTLLKQFLRQLPESVFTQDCVELFAQVGDIYIPEDQLKALNLLIVQLPDHNCQTLRLLFRFLTEVADNSATNRMTVSNIATVMGPSLFPPRVSRKSRNTMDTLTEGMAYTAKTNRITELLLTNQDELFAIPKDILIQLSQIKVK